jgi:hypothetical protein
MEQIRDLARERELREQDDSHGSSDMYWTICERMAGLTDEDCAVDGWAAMNAEKVLRLTSRIASAAHLNAAQAAEVQRIIEDETGWLADAAEAERRAASRREASRAAASADTERRRSAYWCRQYEGAVAGGPPRAA